jgi:type IX secretion system PorP/SprF family membrane protein
MKKILPYIFICVFGITNAQSTFRPSIYLNNLNYYNPASGWNKDMTGEASIYLQHKFVNNDLFVKPTNIFANYLGNTNGKKHHFSASYIFDMYSFYTRNIFSGGYAYSLDFEEKGNLTFGTRVSFALDYINQKKIEQSINGKVGGLRFSPDFDLGINYRYKGLDIGIGARNIVGTKTKISGETIFNNQRLLNFSASYQYFIKDKFGIAPMVMLHLERNFGFDAGLNLNFWRIVDVGYIFRLNQFRNIGTLGVNIAKKYYIGFAADKALLTTDVNADFTFRYKF